MEKKLIVTAKYGSLEFEEVAYPYNPNAHQEQLDSCISSIHQKMKEAGKYEMKDSFESEEAYSLLVLLCSNCLVQTLT